MQCTECYAENPRITPLKGAAECLQNHRQYICSQCGRMICIDLKGEKRARCFMPFGTLEIAMWYLKAAEILNDGPCGIYELIYKRGEKRYRIFRNQEELQEFLKGNKDVRCERSEPVYISEKYIKIKEDQIKYLETDEIAKYLTEREEMGIKD